MRRTLMTWARPLAGALAVLMALTSAAPAVFAAERAPVTKPQATLADAALAQAAKAPKAAFMQGSSTGTPKEEPQSGFFRSSKGLVIAVLFAAGTGWAIYSTKHDRDPVRSPIR